MYCRASISAMSAASRWWRWCEWKRQHDLGYSWSNYCLVVTKDSLVAHGTFQKLTFPYPANKFGYWSQNINFEYLCENTLSFEQNVWKYVSWAVQFSFLLYYYNHNIFLWVLHISFSADCPYPSNRSASFTIVFQWHRWRLNNLLLQLFCIPGFFHKLFSLRHTTRSVFFNSSSINPSAPSSTLKETAFSLLLHTLLTAVQSAY